MDKQGKIISKSPYCVSTVILSEKRKTQRKRPRKEKNTGIPAAFV
jgi:hypothetical protein